MIEWPGGTWDKSWREQALLCEVPTSSGTLMGPWASLVAQLVKSLSAMQKTQVRFLGQEDPLEQEMATHTSILA